MHIQDTNSLATSKVVRTTDTLMGFKSRIYSVEPCIYQQAFTGQLSQRIAHPDRLPCSCSLSECWIQSSQRPCCFVKWPVYQSHGMTQRDWGIEGNKCWPCRQWMSCQRYWWTQKYSYTRAGDDQYQPQHKPCCQRHQRLRWHDTAGCTTRDSIANGINLKAAQRFTGLNC